jgi:diguanylate cyclase (GGDEF)-like protein/PAS domain S-box-containing protein
MNIRRHLIVVPFLFLMLSVLAMVGAWRFDRDAEALHDAAHRMEHQTILAEHLFRKVNDAILSGGSPHLVQIVTEEEAAFDRSLRMLQTPATPDAVRSYEAQIGRAWGKLRGGIDHLIGANRWDIADAELGKEYPDLQDEAERFIALVAGLQEMVLYQAERRHFWSQFVDRCILAAIVIGVLLLFFDLYRQIARPIRRLRGEMQRLSFGAGDFETRLQRMTRPVRETVGVRSDTSDDEIAVLARSFDRLLEYVRNYLRERTEALANVRRLNRELEQRVEERAAELDRIVRLSRDLLCILSPGGRLKSVNPAFTEILGYSEQELLSRPFLEFVHPDDVQRTQAEFFLNQQDRDYEIIDFENRWRRSDGSYRYLQWRVVASEDLLYGVARDVTEQKRLERKLHQAAAVFENTTESVVVTDPNANVLAVNRAFTEITGYQPHEVLGNTPRLWRSQRHDAAYYQAMWASVLETGEWRGEIWNRRKNGDVFPALLTINSVRDEAGGVVNYIAIMTDISALKSTQERFEHLAHHDPLTDLPNRLLFNARLEHALERARREKQRVAVMFIDLDDFKSVNDILGHPVGDELLQEAAQRLSDQLRKQDTVARLAGDEFGVILEELEYAEDAVQVAKKLLTAFDVPVRVGTHELHVTISVGISIFPGDGENATALVKNADAAMFRSKREGRNRCSLYTPELTTSVAERIQIENDLRKAVKREEFVLYYQPQYETASGALMGAEALVRWNHAEQGLILPDQFIPVAEESGLIAVLGEQVLRMACVQLQEWRAMGFDVKHVGVNVAGKQILQAEGLVATVERVLADTGLPPEMLELEILESFIMEQADQSIATLQQLRDLGVSLAIDDFGTGHSSLSYLKMFPIDRLKIDRSFISDIPSDPNDVAITRAILEMARNLELRVVAEGVETDAQLDFLRREGCDEVQGYYFNRPLPADKFLGLLQDERRIAAEKRLAR